METININNEDITSKKIEVEYINWVCPKCCAGNITMEFHIVDKEIMCDNSLCRETFKIKYNS